MNILADQNIPFAIEAFSSLGDVQLFNGRELRTEDLHQTDILLVRSVTRVDRSLLHKTPVRFVASATIGTDHIDLDFLQQQAIGFANAPASNAVSAAEYTLCAILFYCEQHAIAMRDLRVAIVGYGNVGSRVRQRLDALGIENIVFDPPRAEQYTDVVYADWQEVKACNVITAHVPLTRTGKHPTYLMFNAEFFASLAPHTLFINTARGAAVDEAALLNSLAHKELNLMLDVWQNEPAIDPELQQQTLLSTPHIAGYAYDGKLRGTQMIYEATCRFLGQAMQWQASSQLTEDTPLLQFRGGQPHAFWDLVQQAYDIREDSQRLAASMSLAPAARAIEFDRQRKEYPERREFSAFEVQMSGATHEQQQQVSQLGFRLHP